MLKGTLDDFTLPDIFRFLSSCNKTGSLEVHRSAGDGKVYFRDGEVYCAESGLARDPLGQKLVRRRVITDVQLRQALDRQAESGGRLGEVLIDMGALSHEQIEGAVRQQMEDAVFDLLRWEAGEFTYQPGVETETEVPLSASVDNLIMEASRKLEELEEIRTRIPSEHAILAMAPMPPDGAAEINITPDEWRILVLVNGSRTIAEIAESVGVDNFSAMRTFFGLASTGLIEVTGEAEPVPELTVVEEPETEAEIDEPAAAVETDPLTEEPPMAEPITEPEEEAPAPEDELEPGDEELTPSAEVEKEEKETEESLHTVLTEEKPSAFDELDALNDSPMAEPIGGAAEKPSAFDELDALAAEPIGEVESVSEASVAESTDDPDAPVAESDPFAAELLAPETNGAGAGEIPVESGPEPTVDRLAAVKELADLFDQTDSGDASGPPYPAELEAAAASAAADQETWDSTATEGDGRRRVEDDEEITRGLISRLIDGVKGL